MSRSIRQGCPISARIFFLFLAEILGMQIRNNKNVEGFTFGNNNEHEVKVEQHADNYTLPLKNEKFMDNALREMDCFSRVSGMKLNT